jgi:hypothetical protein
VAGIVKGDHRAEVLGHFGLLVGDGDVGVGTEDLRVPAGEVDVVELRQGPVARAGVETLELDLVEELDRRLPPQSGEGPVPNRIVEAPKPQYSQIDVLESDVPSIRR